MLPFGVTIRATVAAVVGNPEGTCELHRMQTLAGFLGFRGWCTVLITSHTPPTAIRIPTLIHPEDCSRNVLTKPVGIKFAQRQTGGPKRSARTTYLRFVSASLKKKLQTKVITRKKLSVWTVFISTYSVPSVLLRNRSGLTFRYNALLCPSLKYEGYY